MRVVIVTGGGTGIGKGIANAFAKRNDQVVIMGRTEEKLRQAADDIGENVTTICMDVSKREQVQAAVEQVRSQFNRIDVLVNNAGFVHSISADTPLEKAEALWDEEMATNLKGSFLMALAVAKHLPHPGGRIINMSSIAAFTGGSRGGVIGYSAAKAGVHGLTVGLARDLGQHGITVNTVAPGVILETDFFGTPLSEASIQARVSQVPMGRAGKPEDVAAAVLYLASLEASYVTGEVLQVNGGWLFGR